MLKYEIEMLVLYPVFFSFISNNMCCLYCQDLRSKSIYPLFLFSHSFSFPKKKPTHTYSTQSYISLIEKNLSKAKLSPSFPHHFLNKSARPLDVSYEHKTIITRTFLLTLDVCDNKDLLWFHLWNPLNLNEKFFCSPCSEFQWGVLWVSWPC